MDELTNLRLLARTYLTEQSLAQLSDDKIEGIITELQEIEGSSSFEKPYRLGNISKTNIVAPKGHEVRRFNTNKRNARTKSLLLLALLNR